jgi:hypothetical protein
MKLKSLVEATSNFGNVEFYHSDEDLSSHKNSEFHVDDQFQHGTVGNQIYKFGDGTKMYLYNSPVGLMDAVVIDKLGQKHIYKTMYGFADHWQHYTDSITGVYAAKPFGPQEVQEFRQVFDL